MSTNVSNDKNASVQHRTKQETQLPLFRICYVLCTYIFGNLALRTISVNPRVEIKER